MNVLVVLKCQRFIGKCWELVHFLYRVPVLLLARYFLEILKILFLLTINIYKLLLRSAKLEKLVYISCCWRVSSRCIKLNAKNYVTYRVVELFLWNITISIISKLNILRVQAPSIEWGKLEQHIVLLILSLKTSSLLSVISRMDVFSESSSIYSANEAIIYCLHIVSLSFVLKLLTYLTLLSAICAQ